MNIHLMAVTHKENSEINVLGYEKLLVGAINKHNDGSNYRDDIGLNISIRNNAYCELTGLYWIWKNLDCDAVAFVHYRRFFAKMQKCFTYRGRYVFWNKKDAYRILDKNDFCEILAQTDVVVKQTEWRFRTNKKIFVSFLGEDLWNNLTDIIRDNYPEYFVYFKKVEKQHTHFNCNMFATRKSLSDKYCEWLFGILEKLDIKEKAIKGEEFHNRELGYVSEFLFKVWILKENLRYEVIPVVNIEDKYSVTGVMNYKEFIYFFCRKLLGLKV